jgi:hypothetical protein
LECSTLRRSRGALLLVAGVVRGRRARKLRLRGDRAAIPPMRVLRGLLLRRQLRLRLRTRGCTGADCCIARRGESARRPRRRTALEGRRQVSAALEQSTALTKEQQSEDALRELATLLLPDKGSQATPGRRCLRDGECRSRLGRRRRSRKSPSAGRRWPLGSEPLVAHRWTRETLIPSTACA